MPSPYAVLLRVQQDTGIISFDLVERAILALQCTRRTERVQECMYGCGTLAEANRTQVSARDQHVSFMSFVWHRREPAWHIVLSCA